MLTSFPAELVNYLVTFIDIHSLYNLYKSNKQYQNLFAWDLFQKRKDLADDIIGQVSILPSTTDTRVHIDIWIHSEGKNVVGFYPTKGAVDWLLYIDAHLLVDVDKLCRRIGNLSFRSTVCTYPYRMEFLTSSRSSSSSSTRY
jgi:hypothetical protein